MYIIFERTGGFMGRKVSLNLDLDDLPPDQAASFKKLVEESDFFHLAEIPAMTLKPDEFFYKITVDSGTTTRTIQAGETSISEALRPLVNELVSRSRSAGKNV